MAKAKPKKSPSTEIPPKLKVVESPKITYLKLVLLNAALRRYKDATSVKFGYMIARNRLKIKPVLEALEEVRKPSDEYKEFTKERVELGKTFAKKDEEGKPKAKLIVIQTPFGSQQEEVFDFVDDDKAEAAIEKLKTSKKWKATVEEQEAKEKGYNEFLEEEVEEEIVFYTLPFAKVPEEKVLRAGDLELFLELDIISEPEEE